MESGAPSDLADAPFTIGQVLESKYRVDRVIGEGAMGLVVEATHLDLDQRVALKFLRREALARQDIVVRFSREARAAAKIRSDHVAHVQDVGTTEEGVPFIVMEYLEGSDLENVVLRSGAIPIADAALYVIQACEGLAAAHVLGIVHRDIKPANLFLTGDSNLRQIKLLDFGISKSGMGGSKSTLDDIDTTGLNTTHIMGSPHYMSPEQIRSTKDVDARADVWSLGVVLYELVTGQTPFTATEVTSIILQVLYEPHRPVRSLVESVPEELAVVIDRCLEKDPTARFQSAGELAIALAPFAPKPARAIAERARTLLSRGAGRVDTVESVPPPSMPSGSSTVPKFGRTTTSPMLITPEAVTAAPPPARPAAKYGVIGAALLAIGIGLFLFAKSPTPTAAPPTTAAQAPDKPVEKPGELPSQKPAAPAASPALTTTETASATPARPAEPTPAVAARPTPPPAAGRPVRAPRASASASAAPVPKDDIFRER